MSLSRVAALVFAVLIGVVAIVPATPAWAGERDEEARAIEMRIKVLVSEAEALKKKGRHDAADILMERAHAWRRELAGHQRERNPLTMEQAERILHGLEMGIEALKALKREAEVKAVSRVADGLRKRMEMGRRAQAAEREQEAAQKRRRAKGASKEREMAERRLEIMRVAFEALLKGEKRDAAHHMEHAIHALELSLQGRRDKEANHVRETAPKLGQQAELLALASRLYREWGRAREAKIVGGLAEELGQIARRKQRAHKGGEAERDIVKRRLAVMRHALPAFREAERPKLVEQMERAVHAYEIALSGRRDEEAKHIWERAPKKEHLAELCGYAAHLWAEWGHEEKAHALKALSRELMGHTEKREHEGKARHAEAAEQVEHLRHRIHELMEQMERITRQLEEVSGEARRAR